MSVIGCDGKREISRGVMYERENDRKERKKVLLVPNVLYLKVDLSLSLCSASPWTIETIYLKEMFSI